MTHRKNGQTAREIAIERIDILFRQAYQNRYDSALANKYMVLAREITMRVRQRMPSEYRRSFCSACHTYFVPGENHRVRIQHGKVISTCKICGAVTRYILH